MKEYHTDRASIPTAQHRNKVAIMDLQEGNNHIMEGNQDNLSTFSKVLLVVVKLLPARVEWDAVQPAAVSGKLITCLHGKSEQGLIVLRCNNPQLYSLDGQSKMLFLLLRLHRDADSFVYLMTAVSPMHCESDLVTTMVDVADHALMNAFYDNTDAMSASNS